MAMPAADASEPAPPVASRSARFLAALGAWFHRAMGALEDYPLERIGFAAIAAGVVLRLATPFFMDFRSDGDTYMAMGHAWMLRHEFLMPYGDVTTWGPTPPQYSNHYPPAYPFYLGVVFSIFGFGLVQAKAAAVCVSLLALVAVYFTTRDLFGRVPAALATGLLGVEPHLLWVTGTGFSENMVLLFFALTMWAILKSLKDDRYIVLAGLFAALAYLSRASVGYFFVVAGGGGFVWRLLHRGWGVLANVWYLLAIAAFASIAAWWAVRNVSLFGFTPETISRSDAVFGAAAALAILGVVTLLPFLVNARLRSWPNLLPGIVFTALGAAVGLVAFASSLAGDPLGILGGSLTMSVPLWETSSYTRYVQNLALSQPGRWQYALLMKVPLFLAFLAFYVVPFLPESWRATKRIREEETSALWLSVFLVWIIAWAISSMFWVFENSSLYWLDNHRYVVIGLLPLGWLLLREARTERAGFRIRYVLLLLSLFAACGATFFAPVQFSDLRAAEFMDGYLEPGDDVAVDGGTIKYAFYGYVSHPEQVRVYGWGSEAEALSPEFIVSLKWDATYGDAYTKVGDFKVTFWTGGVMTTQLFARNDLVAAREIPTGVLRES